MALKMLASFVALTSSNELDITATTMFRMIRIYTIVPMKKINQNTTVFGDDSNVPVMLKSPRANL